MMDPVVMVLLAGCTSAVLGYPSGGPNSACEDMRPKHRGFDPQQVASPYMVDIGSVNTYTTGTPIKVKFTGVQYQGFYLQARKVGGTDTTPIGSWSNIPENVLERTCTGTDDTLTHNSETNKGEIVFTWNPPQQDVGPIEFVATIAQNHDVFWMNQKSSPVNPSSGSPTTASSDSSGGGSETSTQPSSVSAKPTTETVTSGEEKSKEEPSAEGEPGGCTVTRPCIAGLITVVFTLWIMK